jgi:hypothetical protein
MTEHKYAVYGVSLISDIPFDFPPASSTDHDRPHVRFAQAGDVLDRTEAGSDQWFVCRQQEDGSLYVRWSGLYEFVVDPSGTLVRYRALRDGEPAILQNFLFGQTLSFALIRQNVEPVHAAVVDVGGHAIALLGDCTYGKSTLAASLLRAGCRLLSDDLLVVHDCGGVLLARAGAGRIKLLPDAARAVLGEPAGGVPLLPGADKRVFRLDRRKVQRDDVPLGAIVILPTPDERAACARIDIDRVTGAEVFRELVKNTFVRYVDEARRLHQNFASNSHLASAVAGYRLRYPPGIERLPDVSGAITEYFRQN